MLKEPENYFIGFGSLINGTLSKDDGYGKERHKARLLLVKDGYTATTTKPQKTNI